MKTLREKLEDIREIEKIKKLIDKYEKRISALENRLNLLEKKSVIEQIDDFENMIFNRVNEKKKEIADKSQHKE